MTDTLNTSDDYEVIVDDDDTDTITVDTDNLPRSRPAHRKTPVCNSCGVEIADGRRKCDDCKASPVQRVKNSVVRTGSRKKGVSATVENGMSETIGKILLLLTLAYAYGALRKNGIPDANGDVADAMALTDEESVAIARPLSRLFLSTEQGRKIAPSIVDNRDLIDAAFAAWDWYKRTNDVLAQYGRTQSIQTPTTQGSNNGTVEQGAENHGTNGYVGYIPPPIQDVYADV